MALGFQALLADFGVQAPVRVWTDSSAAIGICSRQGLGKLRHLDTHTLWIQQAVRTGRISLRKVPGLANPADLLTKHSLSRERLRDLVRLYGCEYRPGRASLAPTLRRTQGTKTTMADAATEDLTGEIESREPSEDDELIRPVMPSPIQFTRTAMASAGTSAWSATMALPYGEGWNVGAEYYFRCCQDGSCGAGLRNQANPFRVDKNPF